MCEPVQNYPRQLAMQSCVLCSFVRCGTSNQIEKRKKKKSSVLAGYPFRMIDKNETETKLVDFVRFKTPKIVFFTHGIINVLQ